jgi:hypothetical protein
MGSPQHEGKPYAPSGGVEHIGACSRLGCAEHDAIGIHPGEAYLQHRMLVRDPVFHTIGRFDTESSLKNSLSG